MIRMKYLLLFLCVVCSCCGVYGDNHDEVVTCGGFVEATSKVAQVVSQRFDYSMVSVHLYSQHNNLLKYTSECAPNGYYFIPIYDRGSYVLRIEGPDGWTFEPQEVKLEVNEQQRGCADDINFKFTGFTLSGRVTTDSLSTCSASKEDTGPHNVVVQLASNGDRISTVTTDDRGVYKFQNIFPGNYTVSPQHTHILAPQSQEVSMSFGNADVQQAFVVRGHSISGEITSDGAGVAGVDILLYATSDDNLPTLEDCVPKPKMKLPSDQLNNRLLCATKSKPNGLFEFKLLPCGEYRIVPFYHRKATTYDVVPNAIDVSVAHEPVRIDRPFKVLGFSVSGRVVDKRGTGVEGVTIGVNGQDRAVTNDDGYYHLEKMTTGTYTIQATKTHVFFHDLKNFQLSPQLVELPDITVVRYHLCGRVDMSKGDVTSQQQHQQRQQQQDASSKNKEGDKGGQRKVMLINEKYQQRLTAKVADDGHYCFEVVSGEYTVIPTTTAEEDAQGILLSPPKLRVVVEHAPVLNALFTHSRIELSGVVKCIETPCPPDMTVQLSTKMDDSERSTKLTSDGKYTFDGVFPGRYTVKVVHDSWCWVKKVLKVVAEYDDINNLDFIQSGYMLRSVMSHNATLNFTRENAKSGGDDNELLFDVREGSNKFCLADPGVYHLRLSSCYQFKGGSLQYDTRNPKVLSIEVSAFRIRGYVVLHVPSEHKSTRVMVVAKTATDQSNALAEEITAVRLDKVPADLNWHGDRTNIVVYEYAFWSVPGGRHRLEPQVFTLAPKSSGEPVGVLFHPSTVDVHAVGEKCPPLCNVIEARAGLYISGVIRPVVNGVSVFVKLKSNDHVLHSVNTNEEGVYRVGPLDDTHEYVVSASKFGYQLIPSAKNPHNFRAVRLGEIRVVVRDSDGRALDGVLMSLSGEGYRNNSVVGSSGEYVFEGLKLNQYFVRPHMKEYEFTPKAQSIDVGESGAKVVEFIGTRTAYSVFGVVRSLNNEPESNGGVESYIVSENQLQQHEETTTDKFGAYRLRGLIPGKQYTIRVKTNGGSAIERATPHEYVVDMINDDMRGVNFVAMRKLTRFDLTGRVNVDSQWTDTLKVELCAESAPGVVIKTQVLRKNKNFFEFNSMPEDNYVVWIRCSLSTRTHAHSSQEVHVNLNSHKFINVSYDVSTKTIDQELGEDSFLSLILSVIVLVVFYYRNDVIQFLSDGLSQTSRRRSPTTSSESSSSERRRRRKK